MNRTNKKCIICKNTYPSYNKQGLNPLYCGKCKTTDMIDVINKKCIKCNKKRPNYNNEGEIQALYCVTCKQDDMVDVKHKKCIKCKKTKPNYNKKEETIPLYCVGCKDNDMINVTSPKCIKCNLKQPVYNKPGENKGLYCLTCKDPDMIDIKSSKCIKCKNKRPNYNYINESKALFCFSCKEINMVDITHRICKYDMSLSSAGSIICGRRAYYALPGVFPEYCSTHRLDGMIKNSRKKCIVKDCREIATHGLIQSEHCEYHSFFNEYNFAERTCPKCGKIDILNKDGICVNTCSLLEIDNCVKKRKKNREEYVGKIINQNIDTTKFFFTWNDQSIDTSCTKQRPDFVFHCGNYVVIIEVDEEQHKSYKSCGTTKEEVFKTEIRRMYNIGNIFIGIPVIFIRFNPDKFTDKNGEKVKISIIKRYNILIKWIKDCIHNERLDLITKGSKIKVKYLFYDGYDESDMSFIDITESDIL